jgi:hypothetical protein
MVKYLKKVSYPLLVIPFLQFPDCKRYLRHLAEVVALARKQERLRIGILYCRQSVSEPKSETK